MGISAKKSAGINVSDLIQSPREGASHAVPREPKPEAKEPETPRVLFRRTRKP